MRNMSKKTLKKVKKILLSSHFKSQVGFTPVSFVYTPNPKSPLSAIWHHVEVRADGTIWGYLLDDRVKYMVAGSVNRRKVRKKIKSPEQFFHPRCYFARQAKQIEYRLRQMERIDMAEPFINDYGLILLFNVVKGEYEHD